MFTVIEFLLVVSWLSLVSHQLSDGPVFNQLIGSKIDYQRSIALTLQKLPRLAKESSRIPKFVSWDMLELLSPHVKY